MITYIKNKLLPSVDTIMSTFTKTIAALEAKADVSGEVASALRERANEAREESERAQALANKLKSAFLI